MLISEIFHSVQGEGRLVGIPSVFIRTSGCNLRCRWCDTPYASWTPEGRQMTTTEILAEVERFPSRHCVLTGGEPMVAPGIHELADALRSRGKHLTIETAGTIAPGGIACDLASLSPKLAHSTPDDPAWAARHEAARLQPAILAEWIQSYPHQLKFVISGGDDLVEAHRLLAQIPAAVAADAVLLMPEGIDESTLAERQSTLVRLCLQHGHRYCDRLHIRLFGHTRGT